MKICVINEFFKPYVTGGSEIFLEKLINFLTSEGFEIKLVTSKIDNSRSYEKSNNLEIYRIKSSPIKISHMQQLPGITFKYNFLNSSLESHLINIMKNADCFHINNLYHLSFGPLKIAKSMKKPILLDIHDYWPICFRKDLLFANKILCSHNNPVSCYSCLSLSNPMFLSSFLPLHFEYFLRNNLVKSKHVITHSEFVAKKIKEYSNMSSKVIPYPFMGKVSRKSKKIEDALNLIFMGRLQLQKGAHLLPDIARSLENQGINYEISVLGSGPLYNKLKQISKKENLKIKLFGFVNNTKIKENILEKSHVLISPSLWNEPFGIVVLEAMGNGLPIIGSNLGGIRDLILENDIGFSVRPNPENIVKYLKLLKENPKVYKKFSRNGIKNIKKYNSSDIFKKYKLLFESMPI